MIALLLRRSVRATGDDQWAKRMNEAAKKVAASITASYRTASGRFEEARERQTRNATGLQERLVGDLRAGAESVQAASQELSEQAQRRRQEAGEVLARGAEEGSREEPQDARSIAPEEGRAEAEELPIEDYDSLNVHQVTQRLGGLSVEGLRRLRDYEAENKNRRSLLQRFETRIRAARKT